VAEIWKYTGAQFAIWNQRDEGRKLFGTRHEKKLINSLPCVVSNSYEGRDALVKVYGLNPNDIEVINNGIVPYSDEVEFYDWHAHFDIDKRRPLVSMIANITSRKDHKTLLKAWAILIKNCKAKELPLPFLILAGRKADTYKSLKLLGFDLRLSEHIGFTGNLNPVQGLIRQSLFCVFSSNLEGCPNGVLECMEQGKAVIGTHISGIEQALGTKYVSQCLTPPNNPEILAKNILHLYQQPQLMNEIGAYNAKRIQTEFSIKQMVENYLKLIQS
jgi:glycosyltransferase involved in cell wall biosynthesis